MGRALKTFRRIIGWAPEMFWLGWDVRRAITLIGSSSRLSRRQNRRCLAWPKIPAEMNLCGKAPTGASVNNRPPNLPTETISTQPRCPWETGHRGFEGGIHLTSEELSLYRYSDKLFKVNRVLITSIFRDKARWKEVFVTQVGKLIWTITVDVYP